MAGKNLGPTFEAIMRDLEARKFSPIYILMGEEPYYIDKISDFVAENALDESERDFNQTIIFGADTTAAQVADMARMELCLFFPDGLKFIEIVLPIEYDVLKTCMRI